MIQGTYGPLQYWTNVSCIAVFALLASAIARTSRRRYLWGIYPFALMFGLSAVVISLVPALGLSRGHFRHIAAFALPAIGLAHWYYLVRFSSDTEPNAKEVSS